MGQSTTEISPLSGTFSAESIRVSGAVPTKQAVHETAPDQPCSTVRMLLPKRRPHVILSRRTEGAFRVNLYLPLTSV